MSFKRAWCGLGVFVFSSLVFTRGGNAQEEPPSQQVVQDTGPNQPPGPTQSEPQTPGTDQPGPQPPNPPGTPPGVPTPAPGADRPETVGPRGGRAQSETIVVTGSRIPRKDLTTPAPVTLISSEQIRQSGRITLGEYLQSIPEQGNALNTQVNNGGNGATRIDLRGLGNLRTLVLVNGKRMVWTGTGTNSGTGVDVNTIPTEAIERIEVLKDGASAIYGSDAISGVVNIITKKTYAGTAVNGYVGLSQRADGETYQVDATTGTSGDMGSILFSAGFFDQKASFAGDRDWSRYQLEYDFASRGITRVGSTRVPSGRIIAPDAATTPGNAAWTALTTAFPDATSFTYDPTNPQSVGGWRPFNASALPPDGDLYNFQPLNYTITPNRRINLYTTGTTRLGTFANLYFEASYTNRTSDQQLAEEPLIIGAGGSVVTISPDNIYNPFGRSFTQYTKRLVEFGPRIFSQQVDTYRVVGGLNGILPDPIAWTWDVSLNYGRTAGTFQNRGSLIVNKIQDAVGPSFIDPTTGTPTCGTEAAPIANCVPLDLFHGAGAISSSQAANLTYTGVSRIQNELTTVEVNTAGDLVRLLSDRPVGLALGYTLRFESGADIPDPITASGQSTGSVRQATEGRFHANEAYGELSIPIVSNLPFFENLEASAALRFVDYNTFGTNWSYKFGARWQIIQDVTLRGTFSTAFRAPSITELYLGASDNFPNAVDPCADLTNATTTLLDACAAGGVPATGSGDDSTQLRSTNGGNPNLQPETAKIVTGGVVIQPHWVPGLSATLDYYWLKIDDAITTYGVPYILSQCYPENGTPNADFCALITRDSSHLLTNIKDLNVNVGGDRTAGFDLSLRYAIPSAFGRFGLAFDGTYLLYFDRTLAGGTVVKGKGTFDLGNLQGGTGGVYPTIKWLAGLSWGMSGFGAGVQARFIGGFKECADSDGLNFGGLCFKNPTGGSRDVSPYYLFDLYASYRLAHDLGESNLSVGMRNVLDQDPPVVYNSFTPTSDPTAYDFVGRFFYVNVGHRF